MQIEKAYYWPTWLLNDCLMQSDMILRELNNLKKKYGKTQINLWRSLNIYDDQMDSGISSIKLIDANRYYRNFLKELYLSRLPGYFQKWAEELLFIQEEQNKQEITTKIKINNDCIVSWPDLPSKINLLTLSNKSMALSIAPAAILFKTGSINSGKELLKIDKLFKYLLSAKQLADDACDWHDDLQNGIITQVTLPILKEMKKRDLNLRNTEVIIMIFCKISSMKTCNNILKLCLKAKQMLVKCNLKLDGDLFNNFILPLEIASQKAINFKKML